MGREDQDHRHHRGAANALWIRTLLDRPRLFSVEIFRTRFLIGTFVLPKCLRAGPGSYPCDLAAACRIELTTAIRTETGSV